jgi:hypothetical protein
LENLPWGLSYTLGQQVVELFAPVNEEEAGGKFHLTVDRVPSEEIEPPAITNRISPSDRDEDAWKVVEDATEARFWLTRNSFRLHLILSSLKGNLSLSASQEATAACWRNVLRLLYFFGLLENQGVLLHASGLVHNGKTFLFPGVSGAGKTTIVRTSPKMPVLSDEAVAVRLSGRGQGATAYGTPFFGDWGRPGERICAPVKGLFFPRKAAITKLVPLTAKDVLKRILPCIFTYTSFEARLKKVFDLAAELAEGIPGYDFYFQPHPDFWKALDGA